MPPRIKTSKKDVVNAGFEVAKNIGISGITAKTVSKVLETSVAPIFRVFKTLDELRVEVVTQIHIFNVEYIKNYPLHRTKFLTYGIAYIEFAKEYPNLFDALMVSGFFTPDAIEKEVSEQFAFVENSVISVANLSKEQAQEIFYYIWLYTHGIACLVCKKSILLSIEDEKHLLLTAYNSFLKNYNQ